MNEIERDYSDFRQDLFVSPVYGIICDYHRYQTTTYEEYIQDLKKNHPEGLNRSNSGGWHSDDDLHTHPVFQEFLPVVNSFAREICKQELGCDVDTKIESMWANVNNKNSFNWSHCHDDFLSGVFYVKVPKNCGNLIFVNPCVRSFNSAFRNKDFPIEPQNCALLMWPGWLEHYVEPNQSDEDRISISFNIGYV